MSTDRSILPEKLVQDHLYCTKRYANQDKHELSISDPLLLFRPILIVFSSFVSDNLAWKYPVNIVNQRNDADSYTEFLLIREVNPFSLYWFIV